MNNCDHDKCYYNNQYGSNQNSCFSNQSLVKQIKLEQHFFNVLKPPLPNLTQFSDLVPLRNSSSKFCSRTKLYPSQIERGQSSFENEQSCKTSCAFATNILMPKMQHQKKETTRSHDEFPLPKQTSDHKKKVKSHKELHVDKSCKLRRVSSSFVGCHWHRGAGKWVAQISINSKRTHLGYFSTEIEAAHRYDETAKELGRPLNFPETEADEEKAVKAEDIIVEGARGKNKVKRIRKRAVEEEDPVILSFDSKEKLMAHSKLSLLAVLSSNDAPHVTKETRQQREHASDNHKDTTPVEEEPSKYLNNIRTDHDTAHTSTTSSSSSSSSLSSSYHPNERAKKSAKITELPTLGIADILVGMSRCSGKKCRTAKTNTP